MGAVAKSMAHPYDNLELSFGDLKTIMSKIASGVMPMVEKFDGTNMHWYISEDGSPRFARNFTHVKEGGKTLTQMKRILKNHPAKAQFVRGMEAINSTVSAMNWTLRQDGTYWVNCEIIDKENPQCLKYDEDCIVWHRLVTPNEKKNGMVPVIGSQMTAFVEMLGNCMRHGDFSGWKVYGPMYLYMTDKSSDECIIDCFQVLSAIMEKYNLDQRSKIEDLVIIKTKEQGLKAGIPEEDLDKLCNLVLSKKPAPRIQTLRKLADSEELVNSMALYNNRVHWINRCRSEVRQVWESFSAIILEGVRSNLVEEPVKATDRLRRLIEWNVVEAKERIETHPSIFKELDANLERFEVLQVEPPITEGGVFEWKGLTYKITGAFPSMNRVCGAVRYSLDMKFDEGEV